MFHGSRVWYFVDQAHCIPVPIMELLMDVAKCRLMVLVRNIFPRNVHDWGYLRKNLISPDIIPDIINLANDNNGSHPTAVAANYTATQSQRNSRNSVWITGTKSTIKIFIHKHLLLIMDVGIWIRAALPY